MSEEYEKLQEEASAYVGLKLEDVELQLVKENKIPRIMTLDDEQLCGTDDWVTNRVNFKVKNGIITEAWVG
jgi:hypothetical protein